MKGILFGQYNWNGKGWTDEYEQSCNQNGAKMLRATTWSKAVNAISAILE